MEHRRAVTLALFGAVILGIVQFIVLPALDYRDEMDRRAACTFNSLGKTTALVREYTQLQQKRTALLSGVSTHQGTLFAIIERISREQGINNLITSVRPKQTILENNLVEDSVLIRFENMYQSDLVAFLYTMEKTLQGITILNLEIKRTQDALLNAEISLSMTTSNKM